MLRSIRLIPVTMLTAFLLLGLKVGEVMRDGRMLALSLGEEAHAQQADATKPADAKPAEAKPETKTDAGKTDAKPAEGDKSAKTDTKKEGSDVKATATAPAGNGEDTEEEEAAKHEFSQVEIDLLQSLAKRRQELDDWAKQIQLKENMLIAIEGRIDEKTSNLEKMKKEVETLLAKYNEQEDIKTRSLVKIYESMKPKDAARIFEELDMPVLLMVVDRMSERKVAAILENMSPARAKDLTIQLAEQRKLQKIHTSASPHAGTQGAQQPPAAR